jgi:gluconokinase
VKFGVAGRYEIARREMKGILILAKPAILLCQAQQSPQSHGFEQKTLEENAMNNHPLVWVIIGVSGSGKTTVGRLLAQKLECDFLEGDRRHPLQNVIKMITPQPLQEEDRLPWFLAIEDDIRRAIDLNREIVMTCSALKASYREQLTSLGRVQLVWLDVDVLILDQRLKERSGHYMKCEMLSSQIATFEAISPEENVITVDGNLSVDDILSELTTKIFRRFLSMKKPWWERYIE